nr:MAG TPA: Single strand binding protein [Caudoviricetes sp.]
MNKVILLGRLTKDPDVRQSQGAEPVTIARYTLAVNRRGKKQEGQQADFISCVAFGKAGEFAEKYLHKGTKICVSGRIQTGSYIRQDGTKAYTTDVVIEEQEFAESKADSGRSAMDDQMAAMYAGADSRQNQRGQQGGDGQQGSWEQSAMDGFLNIPDGIDEELPFN